MGGCGGRRGRWWGGQGSWGRGCGRAPAKPQRKRVLGSVGSGLAWEDGSLLLGRPGDADFALHPREECDPLPTQSLEIFPHKASGVLMPHEFRTKESKAHGVDSLGRRNSGNKTKRRIKGPGGGVRGWGGDWETAGEGAWLLVALDWGHISAGDEGHCGPGPPGQLPGPL